MQKGDLAGAVVVYRELTTLDPRNAEAFYDLGLALKQQDQFEDAERALRTAMELDRELPEAPFTLGVVLWQGGRAEEAIALFKDAIARRTDYAEAHYMLGTIFKQQGQLDAALEEFRETIRLQPSAEAHTSLGQVLQVMHDASGAAAAFAEAERLNKLKADSQAATFAVNAGIERLKRSELGPAIEKFREAIRLAPDNAQAHFQLALALDRAGAREEARTEFAAARRLAPYLKLPTLER
jgi:Flp pilus assembly protein TadD